MARLPRFVILGQPQHIIQRGNDRQNIFRAVADYQFYLDKMFEAAEKHECKIHAYVLMTNHVHLLITPLTHHGISKMMQMIGRYYVQYFNRKYKRSGSLMEGRYKATLISSERYLLICMRYIELNPVRAKGMVNNPADYPWSSYLLNAKGQGEGVITTHDEFQRLGKTDQERQIAYQQLFKNQIPDATLNEIREATNKAWALGDVKFKKKMSKKLNRQLESIGHGGDRKSDEFEKNQGV